MVRLRATFIQGEFEKLKTELQQSQAPKVKTLQTKFGSGVVDFIEEHLQSTGAAGGVGLVTNQEYRKRKERVELTIAEEEEKFIQQAKTAQINRRQLKQDQKNLEGGLVKDDQFKERCLPAKKGGVLLSF